MAIPNLLIIEICPSRGRTFYFQGVVKGYANGSMIPDPFTPWHWFGDIDVRAAIRRGRDDEFDE